MIVPMLMASAHNVPGTPTSPTLWLTLFVVAALSCAVAIVSIYADRGPSAAPAED